MSEGQIYYEARIYADAKQFNERNAAIVEDGFMTKQAAEHWAKENMQPPMIGKVQSHDREEIKIFKAVTAFKNITG